MRFAAVDVGSNAIRLLLCKVLTNGDEVFFKKASLVRIPLRLGQESFARGSISPRLAERLVHTMQGFKYLIQAYDPIDYRACATSAMREAANGNDIVQEIYRRTGMQLEVVSGRREAEIICSNHFERTLRSGRSFLYVDVGGGSTELTLFSKNRKPISGSFNIGTVRLLNRLVPETRWEEMKQWIKKICPRNQPPLGIGSGGNINKIYKLNRKKQGKPLSYKMIKKTCALLRSYSLTERMTEFRMKPDRADVIVPASEIYLAVMKWSGIKHLFVPQIGLSDGLIHIMYEAYTERTKAAETDS